MFRSICGRRGTTEARLRTLSSSASSKSLHEFLVIAYDHTDSECIERRRKTRPAHLDVVNDNIKRGHLLWGGAMLESTTEKPQGSAILMLGESIDQVRQRVKDDPYVLGKVWDESRITVIPFKTAVAAMNRTQ